LLFCWMKKYAFFPEGMLISSLYFTVGLSYVFFKVLHVIIDAHQSAIEQKIGIIDYLNYTLYFNTLISGPIQTYQDFSSQQDNRDSLLGVADVAAAFERIAIGFFKVMVLAMLLQQQHKYAITSFAVAETAQERLSAGIMIVALYPLYLYCNFSGYTDTVIGAARLLHMTLPENFNYPFFAENFISFWGSWHITLSSWLKTYVYNPLLLTLMRRSPSPKIEPYLAVFAFFATFFLVGAWHGQTSEFLFFGVLQGGGVAVNKLYQIGMTRWLGRKGYRAATASGLYRAASRGLTFTWFAFTLLWFWSDWKAIGSLFAGLGAGGSTLALAFIWIAAAFSLSAVKGLYEAASARQAFHSVYWRTAASGAQAALLFFALLTKTPTPEIVYKAF